MSLGAEAAFPDTWRLVPLRRSIVAMTDGPFGSSLKSDHYADSGVRVIRLGNIGEARFIDHDQAFIAPEYAQELQRHEAQPGDLIVAGLGDENHPLGRSCVLPDVGPAIVKADCFRLRLNPALHDHRFMAWFLSSSVGRSLVELGTRGATRSRVNLKGLAATPVPVLPVDEQRAIADFLDRETAHIDQLRTKLEQHKHLLAERRGAFISHAVTGRLEVTI